MAETHSIRKSGHSSSSFFDWVHNRAKRGEQMSTRRRTLLSGYTLLLCLTGIALWLLIAVSFYRQAKTFGAIQQASRQLETINGLVRQIHTVRAQADQVLNSGHTENFATTNTALTTLSQTIRQTLPLVDASAQFDLQALARFSQDYDNTFRSLGTLLQVSNQKQAQDAEPQIRQSVQHIGQQLDSLADTLSGQAASTLDELVRHTAVDNSRWQAALLLVVPIMIAGSITAGVYFRHRTTSALDAILQAARAVTKGDLSAQVVLSPVRTDEISELALAFNQMAASLQTALQTEAAANEQKRRQIMKLAKQERMTTILEERQRIARELHDSVKQQLFSITLAAGAAMNLLDHDVPLARTYLAHVQQTGVSAQSEMTTLLQEMMPLSALDRHLEDALLDYLTPLCEIHSLKLLWRVAGTNTLTTGQEHALFRIVQESTSNVIRHSKATILRISLTFGLQMRVVIEDNGQGFNPETISPTSSGLATMRLRVKQVGGTFVMSSIIGTGTRIEIMLDLRRHDV